MEKQELREICQSLIGKSPAKVVNKAYNILTQSRPLITLKPAHNLARPYICCVVAIQEMMDDLDLEEPDISKPPIPLKDLNKLLVEFTAKFGVSRAPESSDEELVPRKRIKTPSGRAKRANKDELEVPETPSKSRKRKTAKEVAFEKSMATMAAKTKAGDGDTSKLFISLQSELDLSLDALGVMISTHKRYSDNVTDKWGLAMAIALVVTANSSPDKSIGLENTILRHSRVQMARERMDQWVPMAQRLLHGQREFTKVSVILEPVAKFNGGTGAWNFPLEQDNWWLDPTTGTN